MFLPKLGNFKTFGKNTFTNHNCKQNEIKSSQTKARLLLFGSKSFIFLLLSKLPKLEYRTVIVPVAVYCMLYTGVRQGLVEAC
jgi:hypothetical protein